MSLRNACEGTTPLFETAISVRLSTFLERWTACVHRLKGMPMRATLVVSVCSLIAGCWVESLPNLPPETGGQVILEGVVRHGVDGQVGLLAWPGARIEVVGYGLVTAGGSGPDSVNPVGWFRLQIPSLSTDRNIEFLVFDPTAPNDASPVGRRVYNLLGGTTAQVSIDLDVGARGSLAGRVELAGKPHSGGVIVYAEGIPGADDLSGPDGTFYLHGIPEGDLRVGFIYEDYVVAPTLFIATKVEPYLVKTLDETVRLSPPTGEAATAGVSGRVQLAEEMQASDLELVVSPLMARNSEGLSAADPIKVMELEADGSFAFALDFAEPHTLTLRSKADSLAMPIRSARLHHVRRGSSDLVMAALWATYDEDGDGYADGADTDGDGLSDAVDEDPDNDGCLDEPELTRLDPYSCGDLDGDGIADGMDPDSDGDGDADLEELTMGADGKLSDSRNGEHSARQGFAPGKSSDCGRVIADGEGADVITYVDTDPIPALQALVDHHTYFGDRRLTPLYQVVVPEGGSVKLQAHFSGIQSTGDRFRIVVLNDCGEACEQGFEPRDLSGAMVDCVASERGRKSCPAEPFVQTLTQTSLVWLHRYGPELVLQNCGDGIVSSGEECDDGNLIETDDCLRSCRLASCGDSIVQAGVETCDDGNRSLTDTCAADCQLARCGDGHVQSDVEACDDGNQVQTDACLSDCTSARCGDSLLQAGVEACDDGNQVQTDACLSDCTSARCGDGIVQTDVEACDDGNEADDDACRNTCDLAVCGDGVLRVGLNPRDDGYEACDDGNQNRGDACLNDCSVARCGDRIVQNRVEACDDGNETQTDRCLNDCSVARCGDGHIQVEEDECDDGNADAFDGCTNDCRVLNPPDDCTFVETRARFTVLCRNPLNYAAAEQVCVGWGGHLVTIDDLDDNNLLDAAARIADTVWIGLQVTHSNEDVWEMAWLGRASAYENWAGLEPNNGVPDGVVSCVEMYAWEPGGGMWNDDVCTQANPYLCELSNP
jgi:cysteine-rich repeat protein